MYVRNGIAYAGDPKPILKVSGVRPLDNFQLWVRFNNNEARIFDFKPLLNSPAFAPLSNPDVFKSVYIDYGVTVWNNGEIDIAPEALYEEGRPTEGTSSV